MKLTATDYPMMCDACGRVGTEDDGIEIGGECAYEDCGGTIVATTSALTVSARLIETCDADYGSPDVIEIDDTHKLRVIVEIDQDTSISDFEDCYGKVHWVDRTYHAKRPAGFNGRARKLWASSDAFWWQPPADVAEEDLAKMSWHVRELVEYGFKGVIVELLRGTDTYGKPIAVEHASLWGIDSLDNGYLAEVVRDLCGEINVVVE